MKLLVAIANHGTKNQCFLDRLLREYRSMTRYDVDIVVLSNIPKELGPDVEVRVGLPIKNPWSLPFAHKAVFAERLENYDLFIYCEDDTLVRETHIDAFLRVTEVLPDDYIAGFMRYEMSSDGRKYYSTMHSHYHWDPNSVRRFGEYLFAHYTNEHAACFMLTRHQLRKAIDSGGFSLPPRKGRYGMLETAATDPYTRCGMKKVVCISHFDDFCLHHLPNVYCGKMGLDEELAEREMERLKCLETDAGYKQLIDFQPQLEEVRWNKRYYAPPREDVLDLIPGGISRVLSIGCGCGSTEAELVRKGVEVVGVPLDRVIQSTAESKGLRTVGPDLEAAGKDLRFERFDCVLFIDILQHLPDPVAVLRRFGELLRRDGSFVISVPNWNHIKTMSLRLRARGGCNGEARLRDVSYGKHRLHPTTRGVVDRWVRQSGFGRVRFTYPIGPRFRGMSKAAFGLIDGLLCKTVLATARRF